MTGSGAAGGSGGEGRETAAGGGDARPHPGRRRLGRTVPQASGMHTRAFLHFRTNQILICLCQICRLRRTHQVTTLSRETFVKCMWQLGRRIPRVSYSVLYSPVPVAWWSGCLSARAGRGVRLHPGEPPAVGPVGTHPGQVLRYRLQLRRLRHAAAERVEPPCCRAGT